MQDFKEWEKEKIANLNLIFSVALQFKTHGDDNAFNSAATFIRDWNLWKKSAYEGEMKPQTQLKMVEKEEKDVLKPE